jgi:hypothetical protein
MILNAKNTDFIFIIILANSKIKMSCVCREVSEASKSVETDFINEVIQNILVILFQSSQNKTAFFYCNY